MGYKQIMTLLIRGSFSDQSAVGKPFNFTVSDAQGRVILSGEKYTESKELKVDLSVFPSRIYLLKANTGNGSTVCKLVRN
jgi:hypothetical protein